MWLSCPPFLSECSLGNGHGAEQCPALRPNIAFARGHKCFLLYMAHITSAYTPYKDILAFCYSYELILGKG